MQGLETCAYIRERMPPGKEFFNTSYTKFRVYQFKHISQKRNREGQKGGSPFRLGFFLFFVRVPMNPRKPFFACLVLLVFIVHFFLEDEICPIPLVAWRRTGRTEPVRLSRKVSEWTEVHNPKEVGQDR